MTITHHFTQDSDAVFALMTDASALQQRCSDLGEKTSSVPSRSRAARRSST